MGPAEGIVEAIIVITLLFGAVGGSDYRGENTIEIRGVNPDTCEERAQRAAASYKSVRGVVKVEAHCEYLM